MSIGDSGSWFCSWVVSSVRNVLKFLVKSSEPAVGLHAADVHMLTEVLQRFVDEGNTVLVIEHQPDIIKIADWIIDLGPEGGDRGGYIVATGTPEQVAKIKESYTGQFLKKYLAQNGTTAGKNGNGKKK